MSSGQALAEVDALAADLPAGLHYEWTELTYQQLLAGNTALFVFPLWVLLVFLVLAAQYESWSLRLSVILIAVERSNATRRRGSDDGEIEPAWSVPCQKHERPPQRRAVSPRFGFRVLS
jgi:hypothetical protein